MKGWTKGSSLTSDETWLLSFLHKQSLLVTYSWSLDSVDCADQNLGCPAHTQQPGRKHLHSGESPSLLREKAGYTGSFCNLAETPAILFFSPMGLRIDIHYPSTRKILAVSKTIVTWRGSKYAKPVFCKTWTNGKYAPVTQGMSHVYGIVLLYSKCLQHVLEF